MKPRLTLVLAMQAFLLLSCGGGTIGSGSDGSTVVSGRVTNVGGLPLDKAVVTILETGDSAETTSDGEYELNSVIETSRITFLVTRNLVEAQKALDGIPESPAAISADLQLDESNKSLSVVNSQVVPRSSSSSKRSSSSRSSVHTSASHSQGSSSSSSAEAANSSMQSSSISSLDGYCIRDVSFLNFEFENHADPTLTISSFSLLDTICTRFNDQQLGPAQVSIGTGFLLPFDLRTATVTGLINFTTPLRIVVSGLPGTLVQPLNLKFDVLPVPGGGYALRQKQGNSIPFPLSYSPMAE